jgi:hypothetical protein
MMRNMKICISIRNQSHCAAFFGFGLMQTSTFIVFCVCYELIAQLSLISKHDNLRKVTNRVWWYETNENDTISDAKEKKRHFKSLSMMLIH